MTTLSESKYKDSSAGTCEVLLSRHSKVIRNSRGDTASFVLLNWKGMLRKNQTWEGFRRDSQMINRMKNKTSKERWKELEQLAAFKRKRSDKNTTILLRRWPTAVRHLKTNSTQAEMMREKVMTFTGPTVSTHVTHSYSTLLTSLKFTYSYCLYFYNVSLLSIADQPWLNMLGYMLNPRTWSYSAAWTSKPKVWSASQW